MRINDNEQWNGSQMNDHKLWNDNEQWNGNRMNDKKITMNNGVVIK